MDVAHLQRCGEVFHKGHKQFAIHCLLCPLTYEQLDVFATHIYEHYNEERIEEQHPILDDDRDLIIEKLGKDDATFVTIMKLDEMASPLKEDGDPLDDELNEEILKDDLVVGDDKFVYENDDESMEEEPLEGKAESMSHPDENEEEENYETDSSATQSSVNDNTDCTKVDGNTSITKEILIAIIEAYEQHPLLWRAAQPMNPKNYKQRKEILMKIASKVNAEFGCALKMKNVRTQITKLRYNYRKDLQNERNAKTNGIKFKPAWFYDKLGFLKKFIKDRQAPSPSAIYAKKKMLPLPNLTHAQHLQMIELYRRHHFLWDTQQIGYRIKEKHQEAEAELLETVRATLIADCTAVELKKHLYRLRYACSQEKHAKLQCEQKGETFQPLTEYYEHLLFLEDHVGPFKCPYCAETCKGADKYRVHKAEHENTMPFKCSICDKGFMRSGNCTVHWRRHTRQYNYECEVCKKRFATSTDHTVHMRSHTGEKPYCCEICGQKFRTWTFFDSHMRRHQKRADHKCTLCPKSFYEKGKLREHMNAHLNVRDKVCTVCGKAFTSGKHLRQHQQIHAEKKKYVCRICGKDFAQYAGLSGHMKSHGTTLIANSLV